MNAITENGILRKGIMINDSYFQTILYIPKGITEIDRHAFPFEQLIFENEQHELECKHFCIWFSDNAETHPCMYYQTQGQKDIWPAFLRRYFRLHGIYCTDDDYHPEFRRYFRNEKRKMTDQLCQGLNRLLHSRNCMFVKFRPFLFYSTEEKDYFHWPYVCEIALAGIRFESGCYDFLKQNQDVFCREVLPRMISLLKLERIRLVCSTDLIAEQYMDFLIQKAIETAQDYQWPESYEIQLLLTEYKFQHFGEDNPLDKFRL